MLPHRSRHLPPCLSLDVRQKQTMFLHERKTVPATKRPMSRDAKLLIGLSAALAVILLFNLPLAKSRPQAQNSPAAADGYATTSFDHETISKGAISAIFGVPMERIQTIGRSGDVYHLGYTRQSDGSRWQYKCRVDGSSIIWGTLDGRWRTEERISFSVDGSSGSFIIRQLHADGSVTQKQFRN